MKKQIITGFSLTAFVIVAICIGLFGLSQVNAQTPADDSNEPQEQVNPSLQENTAIDSTPCDEENEVYVSLAVEVDGELTHCIPSNSDDIARNPIIIYLRSIVQFLAVGVGLAITVAIVIAGIQYSASRENPQAIQAATQRLTNAIIALITFIFMAAILNFLVPGGLV